MILFCAVFYFRYGRLPLTEIKNNVWRADFKMQENVAAAMYSVGVHNFSVSCILESSTDIPVVGSPVFSFLPLKLTVYWLYSVSRLSWQLTPINIIPP